MILFTPVRRDTGFRALPTHDFAEAQRELSQFNNAQWYIEAQFVPEGLPEHKPAFAPFTSEEHKAMADQGNQL
jgi:hypothetical protein